MTKPEADEVARERAAVLALRLERLDELLGGQVAAPLKEFSES